MGFQFFQPFILQSLIIFAICTFYNFDYNIILHWLCLYKSDTSNICICASLSILHWLCLGRCVISIHIKGWCIGIFFGKVYSDGLHALIFLGLCIYSLYFWSILFYKNKK